MKFTNGYWLLRKEMEPAYAVEYASHQIEGSALTVYLPSKHISGRGDCLNIPMLTLTLSSDEKGKVTLTDAAFTPMWTYRYETDAGAAFAVLPVNDTSTLEESTGLSGIKGVADESAARTQAIIGAGVEKVKAALPLKSAI